MNFSRLVPAAVAAFLVSATVVSGQRGTAVPAAPAAAVAAHAGLVEKSCVSCHNNKTKTGGLSLQGMDLTEVPANGAVWEKVLLKVRSGEMPPPTVRTRPDPAAAAAFASYLERTLDAAATASPNPGRAPVHRLNRAEYSNAILDLLAVDVKPGSWLPVDDSGYGFDNIAAVLSTSPALLERYMTAGRRISRLAIGDITLKPVEEFYDAKRDPIKGTRNERISDNLPFDSRAGISIQHYFPVDAEYVFKIRIPGPPIGENDPEIDPYQVRIPVKAGLHWVGVTSPRENLKTESEGPPGRGGGFGGRGGGPQIPYPVDLRLNGARVKRFDVPGGTPDIRQLIIGGPYGVTGRGTTASRSKIFVCNPKTPKDEPACARTILTTLARRAFRRPVTNADVQPLLAFYEKGRAGADFDAGIQRALEALLVAPDFLFRIEKDPERYTPGKAYPVNDIELASRLSFFLWSSIPDDQLLELAERGRLRNPAVLQQQVQRMLADRKSEALITNFAGQWLHLRNVEDRKSTRL